jgi:transcriptional regulator with XRE-family HTH domain
MADLTAEDRAKWDRRRRNMRILIAAQGTVGTSVAREAGLSPNTLTKFLNGSSLTMAPRTLEKVLPLLNLSSVTQLDTDNPISDPRTKLDRIVDKMHPSDLERLVQELEVRFGESK